jgi:hypothetical protein
MAWWRYACDVAEVPVTVEVVLDILAIGTGRLTEEEQMIHEFAARKLGDQQSRDRLHRALLAHL